MVPLIIEAAINGSVPKSRNPHGPKAPADIAAVALDCMKAGAALIHTHIEDYKITGRDAAQRYLEAYGPIMRERPDAVLSPSGTYAETLEERYRHLEHLAESGLMRMGTLDPGSLNLANSGEAGLPGQSRTVYTVPFSEIEYLIDLHDRCRLGPAMAIYGPDHLHTALAYFRAGRLAKGALARLYFAGDHNPMDGVKGGFPSYGLLPTETGLSAYLEIIGASALPWMVAIPGGDVTACGLARLAIERGGHVRVGVEDYAGPRVPTNRELVEEVVALARDCGRPVADAKTAAILLGLPR